MQSKKERPLSPHLAIYKPQISSVLSIFHRISGIALFIGLICLVWWVVYLPYVEVLEESKIWRFFSHPIGKVILVLWSYSLFLHFCTGIRHLFWDFGKGFSIKTMHVTGWIVFISSIILTVLSWLIAFKLGM